MSFDYTTLNSTSTTVLPPAAASAASSAQTTQDTFLKMLVAQMQNQDPLNPMDNSQVTSQMAQIQTVSGLSTLNDSMGGLSSQFTQMQALQSVSLVGHDVLVPGNRVSMSDTGGTGTYDLTTAADNVKLEVMTSAGTVIDTQQLGAQSAGRNSFDWANTTYGADANLTYRITATSGAAAVTATTYSQDKVEAVNTSGTTLQLQLANLGMVDYSKVVAAD
ncbi:MAG TPA: flagellar hook capping FlgD N-terminal domain-containing protein [Burkholderiaceae bacterium]|jgi:flagellar basal-body rod modification protein FlgD